jgi:predicted HicB family RNase H-like nuclease
MDVMEYEGYFARVEFDAEDGIFVGHLAGIAEVVSFRAETIAELKEAFHAAVDDYRRLAKAAG